MSRNSSTLIVGLVAVMLIAVAVPIAYLATHQEQSEEPVGTVHIIFVTNDGSYDFNEHLSEFQIYLGAIGATDVFFNPNSEIEADLPSGTTRAQVANAIDGNVGTGYAVCDENTGNRWYGDNTPVSPNEKGEMVNQFP